MGVLNTAAGIGAALAATLLFKRHRPHTPVSGRTKRLHRAYEEAAEDQAYQAEMAEIDRAFDTTVADGLEPFK